MSRDNVQVLACMPLIDGLGVGLQPVQKPPVVRRGVGDGQNREVGVRQFPDLPDLVL